MCGRMHASRATSLVALMAGIFLLTPARTHAAIPLEAYGALPNLENVVVSPDGKRIAFVRTEGDQRIVAVVSLETGKLVSGAKLGEVKPRNIEWADNDHLLIVSSNTGSLAPAGFVGATLAEYFQLSVLDLQTQRVTSLPQPIRGVNMGNFITGAVMVRRVNNRTVLFIRGIHVRDRTLPALFSHNLDTGRSDVAAYGDEKTQQWFVDDAGEIAARVDYDERERSWQILARVEGRLKVIAEGASDVEIPTILGFGADPGSILLGVPKDGRPSWRALSLANGTLGEDVGAIRLLQSTLANPHTHYLIGGSRVTDSAEFTFFDPQMQRNWESILASFKDSRVLLESLSADLSKIVVRVEGQAHGFSYYLVDVANRRQSRVGGVYDAITELHETRAFTYPAADGLEIRAYLTLPRGKPASRLPLVVLPHGGPAVRDTADFDWWSQAFASQGYAVLRPNFRGSALGWEFISKGFGEWGRKMQTDLSDGVRFLVKEGTVDAARVCIAGGSYGGYAALAGVTLDAGVYRCAISVAGLSDLRRFLNWLEGRRLYGANTAGRFWDRFMGATNNDDPMLDTLSPINRLDALNAPVLLIHGRDDTVVPFEQSERMAKAMRRANKPVELVTLKKEDHWLSRAEMRQEMLRASVAFLRQHNPPD